MQQSAQIYSKRGFIQLDAIQDYDLTHTSLHCDLNWKQRYFRAEAFMDAAECIWIDQDETVVLSLIGQAVEQICLGLIYVFMGYRPKQHSLHHLVDLCNNFTKEVDHIFPRQTEQDRNIFSVLSKSSSSARFVVKSSVDPTDCGLLHRRARLLLEKSERIVEPRLINIAEG
jgi:HEPN domain-containing protein